MRRLTQHLISNSIEAFVLALETINRPSARYRMEAFCFLFCNAWELLMKAKLFQKNGKIYYRKKRKKPRRSLSIDDCLTRVFTSSDDPVRLNIERIHDLRNNATHLVVPFVPRGIMGVFQAGVLNYPRALRDWFGINLSDRMRLGMMPLVYDFDPKEQSLDYAKMRRRLPAETIHWLTDFQEEVRRQAVELAEVSDRFYIPIEIKVGIVRSKNKADITISSGDEIDGTTKALVFQVPKDPDKTHPYRRKEVLQLVNSQLGPARRINNYDMQCIKEVYKIKAKGNLYYKSKFGTPQYSPHLVDWIVKQVNNTPDFSTRVRAEMRRRTQGSRGMT